jgi:hypothetical protein
MACLMVIGTTYSLGLSIYEPITFRTSMSRRTTDILKDIVMLRLGKKATSLGGYV